jgi:hypothetical protein
MKRKEIFAVLICIVVATIFTAVFVFRPIEAQRAVTARYEYAVINGSYSPFPAEGPTIVTAAVNICVLQQTGCQNEEVKADIGIAKFLQDERLENNGRARTLVQERAAQVAFSKAIAKLGSEGWEMIAPPMIEFDLFFQNQQGITTVKEGQKTDRQHIWFKRPRQ